MLRCPIFIAGLIMIMSPALARGAEFRIVPSLAVKGEYNNNILLLEDDIKEDFISTISPGIEIADRTERSDTNIELRINRVDYAHNREFNSTDQAYRGRLRYLLTPLFVISADAGYLRDSRPDRDIETTGIVLSDEIRHQITSSLSSDYQLTEKTAAGLSYGYSRNEFEGQTELGKDTSHDANIRLVHDLGAYVPMLKGTMNAGYSYYYAQDSRIRSVMGTIGVSRDIDEVWSVLVDGGVRRTWSEISVTRPEPVYDYSLGFPVQTGNRLVEERVKNADWGWVGQVSLNYDGERGQGNFSYSRAIQPAIGQGGAVERNALTLSTWYRLIPDISLLFTADYYTNKSEASEFSAQEIDQGGFRLRPGVRYEFSKDMTAEASYDYADYANGVSGTETGRHLVSVRFYVQHPFLN
ncbi:MAG: hypothetical protein C4581_00625 [Nitrospiraceae bacterium]|nr:MAG: hypothetical protein C4581_00625 [Nitrospiraceae bacterium]